MRPALLLFALLCSCSPRRAPQPPFLDVAQSAGLRFTHDPGLSGQFYLPEIMGSGAALFDMDNDGDLDVFLIQSSGGPHQLYRNEIIPSGRLSFSRLPFPELGYGMGVTAGDFDRDGWTDLYVTQFGNNLLLRNIEGKAFRNVTAEAGVGDRPWATSAAFLDYDRDSLLDLIVLHYVDFVPSNNVRCMAPSGARDYCTPRAYQPLSASLYHNDGNGRFRDVSLISRISSARGPGLGLVVSDVDDDGWPDIFVANDTSPNLLWMNQRNGMFREVALTAGVAFSEDGIVKAGMGVAAGDFDNDGDEDLIVTNLAREGATLFRRDGPALFSDASLASRLRPITFPYTGFGVGWLDFDHDGWLDLFIANGAVTEQSGVNGFAQFSVLLRNLQGRQFVPMFQIAGVGRGAVLGDIDNDGDIDILVTNNNGPVQLLRNDAEKKGHWLLIKTIPAEGVRIAVERRGKPPLWRRPFTGSSYLSSGDARIHFGLGDSAAYDGLRVRWPDGTEEHLPGGPANRIIFLTKTDSSAHSEQRNRSGMPTQP